jgi:hypothetical protein
MRHINDPGHAAFAVMQLSARCMGVNVDCLLDAVYEPVGELDFLLDVGWNGAGGSDVEHVEERERSEAEQKIDWRRWRLCRANVGFMYGRDGVVSTDK